MRSFLLDILTVQNFFKVASLLLIICAFFLIYIFYLLFFPASDFSVKKVYPLDKKEYVAGETIRVKIDYCKKNGGNVLNTIEFVDNVIIPSFSVDRYFESGCGTYSYIIAVPIISNPGTYHIEFNAKYSINQLKTASTQFHTTNFRINIDEDLLTRVKKLEDKLQIAGSSATPIDERVNRIETQVIRDFATVSQSPTPNVIVINNQPTQTPTPMPIPTPTMMQLHPTPTRTPLLPIQVPVAGIVDWWGLSPQNK